MGSGTRVIDLSGILFLTSLTCLWGSCNDVLSKVAANLYTQRFAFFVDQGNNLLYVLFAAVPMFRYFYTLGGVPNELKAIPQYRFVIMGLLDAFGTFLSSIGAPACPGHLQVVLSQTLIPFTMICSYLFLSKSTTLKEAGAACIILAGAMISISGRDQSQVPSDSTTSTGFEDYAILIYVLSNIPMAFSNVYKEVGFQAFNVDVWSMTCIVCFYQTFWTFALLFFQTFPVLSGHPDHGLDLRTCWRDFVGGAQCFLGSQEIGNRLHMNCSYAGLMLIVYVVFNLSFNTVSMSLTQYGSKLGIGSVLCSLAYAVKLPLSNILFAQPLIMGGDAETLSPRSILGLAIVVSGFLVYLWAAGEAHGEEPHRQPDCEYQALAAGSQEAVESEIWAFHERVVGCDLGESFRKLPQNPVKSTLAELGLAKHVLPGDVVEPHAKSLAEAVMMPFQPERRRSQGGTQAT